MPEEIASAKPVAKPVEPAKSVEAPPPSAPLSRQEILDDPKLNDILASIPGATVTDIK